MDLTQTSYSTVPSVDIELGDKASDHSQSTLNQLGDGLVAGVKAYFGQQYVTSRILCGNGVVALHGECKVNAIQQKGVTL